MHPEKWKYSWLRCFWAVPSIAAFLMLPGGTPALGQDREVGSAPEQEATDARPVRQELTATSFVRKSDAEQRAALIEAIDSCSIVNGLGTASHRPHSSRLIRGNRLDRGVHNRGGKCRTDLDSGVCPISIEISPSFDTEG